MGGSTNRNASVVRSGTIDVLRSILEGTGWMDRSAVEVQAEERGLSWRTARTAIDLLIERGQVVTRASARGFERIAWHPSGEGP